MPVRIDCPNCGHPVSPTEPGHSTGCVIGALLTVLEDRGYDFADTDLSQIDTDSWWDGTFGPAADEIEKEIRL